MTVAVSADITSFVAPRHSYKPTCLCKDGYGGEKCEIVANECARNPCAEPRVCRPDPTTAAGYTCRCPESNPECANEVVITSGKCSDSAPGGGCYEPRHPLSFTGKSYAQYTLGSFIDRHLNVALRVRTFHPTGNVMFAAGRIDYSILEIVNGHVQYRFDCGSGEGLVRVTSTTVNDGNWHEIRLERLGNLAEIIIDGTHRSQGAAPGVNDVLNLESNDVFFGAEVRLMPSVHQPFDDVRMGFVGCMDDIRINDNPLPHQMNISPVLSGSNSLNSNGASVASLKRFTNVEFVCRTPLDRPGNR